MERRLWKYSVLVVTCCCLFFICFSAISALFASSTTRPRRYYQQQQPQAAEEYDSTNLKMVFLDENEPEDDLAILTGALPTVSANYNNNVRPNYSTNNKDDNNNLFLKLVCLFGIMFSLLVLAGEQWQLFPRSFQRFSVSTKVPIEIFCVTGPVVLLASIIYTIMLVLLVMDSNTSSVFFLAASWTAILMDMTAISYEEIGELSKSRDDLIMHSVNLLIVYSAFHHLRFVPYTFILCGFFFWATVTILRLQRGGNPQQQQAGGDDDDDDGGGPNEVHVFRPGSP